MFVSKNFTCYYLDCMIKFEDFNFEKKFIYEISHKIFSIYGISYESLIGRKPLHIKLDKIDGIIKICIGNRYLNLFCSKWSDAIYEAISNAYRGKRSITYVFLLLRDAKLKVCFVIFSLQ